MTVFLLEGQYRADNERPIRIYTYPPRPIAGRKFVIVLVNDSEDTYTVSVYIIQHDGQGNIIEYSRLDPPITILPGGSETLFYPRERVRFNLPDGRAVYYSIVALDYYTKKQISGAYFFVPSGSTEIQAVYRDASGREIPLSGATVRLWRNIFGTPEIYTTGIDGKVKLPGLRWGEKGKAILEVEKKDPSGNMYYYCEAFDDKPKKIVVSYGYAFLVSVELNLRDLKKWLEQIYVEAYPDSPPQGAKMLWDYFVWIQKQNWSEDKKKYHMRNVLSAVIHDLVVRNAGAYDYANRIVSVDIDYDKQKVILNLRAGFSPWIIVGIIAIIVGGIVSYKYMDYLSVKVAYTETTKQQQIQKETYEEILNAIQNGIISKEVGEDILKKLTDYWSKMSQSTQDILGGGLSGVINAIVLILPLMLIAMLIKSIRGVVKR